MTRADATRGERAIGTTAATWLTVNGTCRHLVLVTLVAGDLPFMAHCSRLAGAVERVAVGSVVVESMPSTLADLDGVLL